MKIKNISIGKRGIQFSNFSKNLKHVVILFDLILYVPVDNFSVMSGRVLLVEPVLSKDKCVLFKDTMWLSDAGEAWNCNPSISRQALYHWATALSICCGNSLEASHWYEYHSICFHGEIRKISYIIGQMSRDMWFPAMWHFDKCRLRRACAISF